MSRIRTIKPEFFLDERLYDLERETGLPIRVAYPGLWTQCDRAGRFEWRPRKLKVAILPYDDIDFSRVLHALTTRGFVQKYTANGEDFGFIPGFLEHQVINNREKESELPEPPPFVPPTRAPRVNDACLTEIQSCKEEGKGREGKGKEQDIKKPLRSESSGDETEPDPGDEPEPEPPEKPKPAKYKFEVEHHELAVRMSNSVKVRFPTAEINLDQWADCIRKLIEIDKHTRPEIIRLWQWIVNHETGNRTGFSGWADNCRSPLKLRQRKDGVTYFEIIQRQMIREANPPPPPSATLRSTGERSTRDIPLQEKLTDRSWSQAERSTRDIPLQESLTDRSWAQGES